ncbi:MAG: hypothetical protein B193_1427 [Solidesulfovibrio magneticus str. Maddingley MBC34]|uniref:Uncharacterized protein n=1 Tax=Solidesulfovibrio magneticus str. Maddingley MBC34 TaxID=1206767 RepID=K6GSB7_9BACT|nr:MAG: hypothetical protein B193_1427 [Solidesulfovibrio magneticus str. Maddingley MBC34]
MDARHCAVCGNPIELMDVYILRAQGKICSRCVLSRGIPVSGRVSRQALWRGEGVQKDCRPGLVLIPG